MLFSASINLQAKFIRPHLNISQLCDSGSFDLKFVLDWLFFHVYSIIQGGKQQFSVFSLLIILSWLQ